MIIVKCEECGELIHKADRCFSCGNTKGFKKILSSSIVHENVHDEFDNLENLVRIGKFEDAIKLSRLVLEWMSSCSDVFWLRVLAKNHCTTDEELIRKGFSVADSADFHNAIVFADDDQKKAYSLVATKIEAAKESLRRTVIEHEYAEKTGTAIMQHQAEFPIKVNKKRKKLFELWLELDALEHEIHALENDCMLLVHEHKEVLESANSAAWSLKAKTYKLEQCTAEDLHKYQIQFGDLLHQSEQAKSSIDSMKKQHPWITTYNELIQKRDSLVNHIINELSSLKSYENRVQSTVSEIERIEMRHKSALSSIESFHFTDIRSLLGENCFVAAFSEAGIR